MTTIPSIGLEVETIEYKNISFTVWDIGGQVEVSKEAKSGDGTVEKVGIKVDGKFKSHITNQCFDSQRALDLHHQFLHDPNAAGSNLAEWEARHWASTQLLVWGCVVVWAQVVTEKKIYKCKERDRW